MGESQNLFKLRYFWVLEPGDDVIGFNGHKALIHWGGRNAHGGSAHTCLKALEGESSWRGINSFEAKEIKVNHSSK